MTYVMAIAYLAIGTTLFGFQKGSFWIFQEPIWFGATPPTLGDATDVLNSGNILAMLFTVGEAGFRGTLASVIPDMVRHDFYFQGTVTLICLTYSVLRLRGIALKQSYGRTEKVRWYQRFRPPVGDLPVLWKELNIEGSLRVNWLSWIFVILLILLSLGSGVWIVIYFFWEVLDDRVGWHSDLFEMMNVWVRIAGTGVACLSLLGVAVRASTTIRSEMDKDTFDALITTPLSSNAILLAKFVGSVFSVRLGWLWLGSILALALVTEGMYVLALPLFLGAWVIYAVLFAMIGLWFSMVSKTTMRATVYTMLTTIGVSLGHWMIWMCCGPMMVFLELGRHGGGNAAEYLAKFQWGITPPLVLGLFAYSHNDFASGFGRRDFGELVGFSLLGLFLYTMAALMLWFVLIGPRFRHLTRRDQSSSESE
jgi:ABC-type transport system involved in multi-copper enzyme maturation permease subunit